MKCKSFFLVLILFIFLVSNREKIVSNGELPAKEREFIEFYFPAMPIVQVIREWNGLNKIYKVVLGNQVRLEFDKNGECVSVESRTVEKLPDSVIPDKILQYVRQNFTDIFIIEWEKEGGDQEVKLSSRVELVFDSKGDFLRVAY